MSLWVHFKIIWNILVWELYFYTIFKKHFFYLFTNTQASFFIEHHTGAPAEGAEGSTSALTSELLSIELEMKSYLRDRRQLR